MTVDEIVERYCGATNRHDLEALCFGRITSVCEHSTRTTTFAAAPREQKNREQSAKERCETDNQPRTTPGMEPPVVSEIAFVTLGDLLLRATGFRHRFSN